MHGVGQWGANGYRTGVRVRAGRVGGRRRAAWGCDGCRVARSAALTAALTVILAIVTGCGGGDGPTPPATSEVAAVCITANRTVRVEERGTVTLAAEPRTAAGAAVPGFVVTWSTPDTAVARVSAGGVVTAVAPGTARIVATARAAATTAGVVTDTATVTVTALPVAAVAVADTALPAGVAVGETAALVAEPRAADGIALVPTPDRAVTWATSDAGVATVAAGADGHAVVTARALGTAVVTAASGGVVGTTTVRVVAAPLRFVVTADPGVPASVVAAVQVAVQRWEHLVVRGSGASPDARDPGCQILDGLAPGQYPVRVHVVSFGAGASQVGSELTACNRIDYQPAAAEITLDVSLAAAASADLAAAVAAHEIGHGFNLGGWRYGQAAAMVDGDRTVFTGPRAAAAWQGLGGSGFAPLQVGAPGPVAHWSRAGGLCGDLMNPIASARSVISAVSLGALQDLGWTVAPERAEPFPRAGCA